MISLEAKNLGKWFGLRKVFEGVQFRLENKGTLVISGRNGSGKTTLLKVLSGLLRPTTGQTKINRDGEELSSDQRRNLLGSVMPDMELYGELTAVENLLFLSRIRGSCEGEETIREKIDRMGLEGRGDDPVSSFSSGMKQRLKYAFALLNDPQVLFLDEPTAYLDEEGTSLVHRIIDVHREKALLIIATNEKSDLRYADQNVHLGN
jgi:heme exporter protein A